MLFWMARRTVRGLTRTRRCNRNQQPFNSGLTTRQSWIVLAVLTCPLWGIFPLILAYWIIAGPVMLITTAWHQGPWGITAVITAAVAMLGALIVLRLSCRPGAGETALSVKLSPTTTRYYTCCGMPAGQPHANTCRQTPPSNPAQWSDRR